MTYTERVIFWVRWRQMILTSFVRLVHIDAFILDRKVLSAKKTDNAILLKSSYLGGEFFRVLLVH